MSKLVELLNHDMIKTAAEADPSLIASEPYARGRVDALNAALPVLPAHDAEIREQAMREQMEADCAVVCRRCREGESVFPDDVGEAVHPSLFGNVPCRAWDIRAAYAKAHRESWTKEAEHAE